LQQEKYDKILSLSDKLDQSSQGLSNLLDNLLTWASGQRGLLPYEPQLLNTSDIVKECLALFQDMATSKEIILSSQIPENLWTYADKNGFRVIIRNLVGNALKFTYANGSISVNAKIQEKEIIFSVADTGIGMDDEILQRLFEQKTVNHNIASSFGNGAGLGLMLCKDFVKLHGGKIWAESVLGKGTTFYFTLPFTESFLNNNIIMNGSFKKSNIFSKI
jgi:signal transduction histidine kinase